MVSSCTHCKCSLWLHVVITKSCTNVVLVLLQVLSTANTVFISWVLHDSNYSYCMLLILFPRLVGFPPFWHRKQLVMLRSIMDGKYEFVSPEWDDISEQAKDLVSLKVKFQHSRLHPHN